MKLRSLKRAAAYLLCLMLLASFSAALAADGSALAAGGELKREWKTDQDYTLADPAPWNLAELQQAVDVQDPASVAAYFVWAVTRLVDSYTDGMDMMKYLFADYEPYSTEGGYIEGGKSGRGGWDPYFTDRLSDPYRKWLPRAFFRGAGADNGFRPDRPLTIELTCSEESTASANLQAEQEGRESIVYRVESNAAGHQVEIVLSRFAGSDRWYVTSGATSNDLFYDQFAALTESELALAGSAPNDASTAEEHIRRYGDTAPAEPEPEPAPFTDVPEDSYYVDAVDWAYANEITTGTSSTTFSPEGNCTRGQVVTFLWRAAGKPTPTSKVNPFTDVKESDYFYEAVLWAVEQGITKGTSETAFSPKQTCSSAHIITFLYRAMGVGADGWGADSRDWAFGAGLTEDTGLEISSREECPRGAVVAFLYRIYAEIEK